METKPEEKKCCGKCISTPWGTKVLADGIPICYDKKCSCHAFPEVSEWAKEVPNE